MSLRLFTKMNKFLFGFEVHLEPALFILKIAFFEIVFNWNTKKLKSFNISNRK